MNHSFEWKIKQAVQAVRDGVKRVDVEDDGKKATVYQCGAVIRIDLKGL